MSPARLILAHDLGTTGNKANLFDADGALLGSAFSGYATAYPQPNWAEQNPDDWWRATCETTQRLLAETGADPTAIAAVSFSGQMMGCVAVDANGAPLRSCIIWADQRAQEEAEEMADLCGGDEIYLRCGHRASPAYSAPKILWVRRHQPELYARAVCLLQPKDYVVYQLTGEFATDYSDASGTLLFDLVSREWHSPFLKSLDLSADRLPRLLPSTGIAGEVSEEAAAATGLRPGTPVVIGGGDGSCAGAGAGVIEPGDCYCYIGSSAWVSTASAAPVPDARQRTVTFHHIHPERYAPMGTMQAAGGSRDWAWRLLHDGDLDLDEAAAQAPPGANGLICLPYIMGERSPYWNPLARGTFVGMTMPMGKAEMARAVLEGVAINLRFILDALREQSSGIRSVRLIGGGGRSPLWRQILADCFQVPVEMLALTSEATSWGAAVVGGVGAGIYDWSIAAERSRVVDAVEPIPANMAIYDDIAAFNAGVYEALQPIYVDLAKWQAAHNA
jgi:xylulokinase